MLIWLLWFLVNSPSPVVRMPPGKGGEILTYRTGRPTWTASKTMSGTLSVANGGTGIALAR